ncbi:MAG: Stp1/IreP family PP2C-type Ser/Thr phosphatase [Chloroflexi bacterium]|nr:Stp1/IreP family PP2C-type Ser/Thr phosphatase [Chloroflexota bacterium]
MQTLYEINYGIKSDVGRVRKNNEDYITFFVPIDVEELKKNGSLFIVADGVGGAAKGEVASHFAADTVIYEYYNNEEVPPAERLARAMQHASREIFNHSQENGNFTRMATTMVAALVLQNNLIVAHVGDSRLYLIREGKIKQITRDHSVVAEMVRNGAMTEEEARTSKAKNRISRSIGGEADVQVDVSAPIPLNLNDRILLCSDGLTRYLDGETLMAAVLKGEVESVSKELVKYANDQGGADNVSVVLLEMVEKTEIKIKKPSPQPTPIEKLDWDEMQTQYHEKPQSKRSKRIRILAMGVSAGLLLITAATLMFKKKNSGIGEVGPTPSAEIVVTQEEPTFIKSAESIFKTYSTPTVSGENQNGEDQTNETVSQPESETGEMLPIEKPWICVYKVQGGDNIGAILLKFSLSSEKITSGRKNANEDEFKYFSSTMCSVNTDDELICALGKEKPYSNNNNIKPEEWIIVYSSTDGDIIYLDSDNMPKSWGKDNCLYDANGKDLGFVIEGGIE